MNNVIPIFFASDKNYLPCLSVAIRSLLANVSKENTYHIYVLTPDITQQALMEDFDVIPGNVTIRAVNINDKINSIKQKAKLRDYYSLSIYSRLFIPEMFTEYDKIIYLDCDIIVNADIAKMHNVDISDNYLGCVLDKAVVNAPEFIEYVIKHVGCDHDKQYFNSGVLLMNNTKCRESGMLEAFYDWLNKNQSTVAPDQDFLNIFCKNKVTYLPAGWDEMPIAQPLMDKDLFIIHYNMFKKPWKYKGIMYEDYFWKYAQKSKYFNDFIKQRESYTDAQKEADSNAMIALLKNALKIARQYDK